MDKSQFIKLLAVLFIVSLIPLTVVGSEFHLINGDVIQGRLVKVKDGTFFIRQEEETIQIGKEEILWINVKGKKPTSDAVKFQDSNLEKGIRTAINKSSGAIYKEDLRGLEYLEFSSREIQSLNGLENCVDATFLNVDYNDISYIRPLSDLSKLEVFRASRNDIRSLEPLSGLTHLRKIHLFKNNVRDLSPLSNLKNLRFLHLAYNNVQDLDPLQNLTSLTWLDLMGNEGIEDISPISNLSNLTYLSLTYNNKIKDFTPLAELKNLKELDLMSTGISDLSPIKGLKKLQDLQVTSNQISDLRPISSLTNIQYLIIRSNKISSLQPLADNPGLNQGDEVYIYSNSLNLSEGSKNMKVIEKLRERGVRVKVNPE